MKILKKSLILLSGFSLCFSMITQADSSLAQTPVLIFVSFSMPMASLQQWSQQAKRINAPLVMQGLVQNSFAKTQQAIKALSADNTGSVVLDPRLFRDYHVTQVPAVVVRSAHITPCPANQSCWQPYDIVSGDRGLEAALHEIANHGDVADVARAVLERTL